MIKFMTDICLASMPLRNKEIARAYYNEGQTQDHIAIRFQVSQSTVCRAILKAGKELNTDFARWLFRSALKYKTTKEIFNDRNDAIQQRQD